MSKKIFKLIPVLAIMVAMIAGSALSVSAVSYDYTDEDFHCYFLKNQKMDTNFTAKTVAQKVENLQPGDDMTFKVTYANKSDVTTDWYMENAIEKTLEEGTKTRKTQVSGIGEAENGGYSYELIHVDKNGTEDILFNSKDKKFGSKADEEVTGKEGLKQATNALEKWFYVQTLEPGQSGEVILKVALEGETEVNDYMETDGELNVRFAVEVPKTKTRKIVKTGDYTNITRWVAIMMAAAVLLIILAVFSKKKDRKEAYNEKH